MPGPRTLTVLTGRPLTATPRHSYNTIGGTGNSGWRETRNGKEVDDGLLFVHGEGGRREGRRLSSLSCPCRAVNRTFVSSVDYIDWWLSQAHAECQRVAGGRAMTLVFTVFSHFNARFARWRSCGRSAGPGRGRYLEVAAVGIAKHARVVYASFDSLAEPPNSSFTE